MEDKIIIRKAIKSDVKKLSILYKTVYIQTYGIEGVSDEFANFITKQFSENRIEGLIENNPDNIIVAEYRNNLVGVAEIGFDKVCPIDNVARPELNKLYILEWFCGKGIGNNLLNEVERVVLSKNITEIWLWVLISNNRAISFYEKHNFKTIGTASFQMETNNYENFVMLKKLQTL